MNRRTFIGGCVAAGVGAGLPANRKSGKQLLLQALRKHGGLRLNTGLGCVEAPVKQLDGTYKWVQIQEHA